MLVHKSDWNVPRLAPVGLAINLQLPEPAARDQTDLAFAVRRALDIGHKLYVLAVIVLD